MKMTQCCNIGIKGKRKISEWSYHKLKFPPFNANLLGHSNLNRFLFCILVVFLSNVLVSARIHKQHKNNIDKVKKYFANKARMHRPGATWEAGENDLPEKDPKELKALCGTVALTRKQARSTYHPPPPSADYNSKKRIAIDPEFDASVKWPQCTAIKQARDQGACGSCWAFAGAEAMTDRYCIASGGTKTKFLSTQDIVVCSGGNNANYCGGNLARAAYIMMTSSGVVSETCMPYTSGTADASIATSTSQCTHTCSNTASGLLYPADKAYGTTWYEMGTYFTINPGGAAAGLGETVVRQIQYELMTRGPMTIQIKVYDDFYTYTSGVYQHITGDFAGNHAMKLIGWGTENGTDYWLIMNSWGTSFGTSGAIKIIRGINHLGIEDYVVAGMVDPNLTAPPSNLACNLAGCQGRSMYGISPADTCSTSFCACYYLDGVWNATKSDWDWVQSPRVVSCDEGQAFDASGSVLACVDRTLVPACSVTTASTTTQTTTAPTTTTSTTTPTTTTSTTKPTTTTPTTTTSTTTPSTTIKPTTTQTTTVSTTAKPTTTQATTTSTSTRPTTTSTTTKPTTTSTTPSTTPRRRVPLTTGTPTTTSTTASTTPRRRVPLTTTKPTTTTQQHRGRARNSP